VSIGLEDNTEHTDPWMNSRSSQALLPLPFLSMISMSNKTTAEIFSRHTFSENIPVLMVKTFYFIFWFRKSSTFLLYYICSNCTTFA